MWWQSNGWWDANIRGSWKKKLLDLPSVGNMSSTNSANPMSCAAGIAVLEEIKISN